MIVSHHPRRLSRRALVIAAALAAGLALLMPSGTLHVGGAFAARSAPHADA